jgi:predicted amidophosphoribosyltransferase
LLLDDIITTGATVSECARVLQTAGAAQVLCAAVAARGDGPK